MVNALCLFGLPFGAVEDIYILFFLFHLNVDGMTFSTFLLKANLENYND